MSHHDTKAIGGRLLTTTFMAAVALIIVMAVLLVKRFGIGLGAVTNMNDGYAWGLWIAYDVLVGTAFACGGFAMALLVYIFNKGEYHPLVRPAILTSVFGYTLAGVSIFFDIGRYWQFYNIILPWHVNLNSVMAEVALCILSYVVVLWIEFTPAVAEGLGQKDKAKKLNKLMFFFIGLGVLLPTMHQSSLGTLMVIAGQKLSPLWQTNLLPVLFLISAITMGYSIVVFESLLSSSAFKRPLETKMLEKLSGVIPWLLIVYLVIRFGEILMNGKLGHVFSFGLKGNMFLLENLLFIVPAVLLFPKEKRSNPGTLFLAAFLILIAGSMYRFDTYLVGFDPGPGWRYFPSASEILITLGVISVEVIGYLIFVKKFPVLPKLGHA